MNNRYASNKMSLTEKEITNKRYHFLFCKVKPEAK